MAAEIPVIPKAEEILIHTGNIVSWNRLKKKLTQTPSEEVQLTGFKSCDLDETTRAKLGGHRQLTECISSTFKSWLETANKDELQYATNIACYNHQALEKLPPDERADLKLTVKIFMYKVCPDEIKKAIQRVMCELGVTSIDTVIISLPDEHRNMESIQLLWTILEQLIEEEKVFTLGVSDLDKKQLEELYNLSNVKPSMNQVNLDTCCVIPPELQAYAKENDIQLLTHNDPTDILPGSDFQSVVRKSLTERDGESWSPCWVIRYSVLVKHRGILKTKGYIVNGCRDLRKRP